jgi:hypothetical protein
VLARDAEEADEDRDPPEDQREDDDLECRQPETADAVMPAPIAARRPKAPVESASGTSGR